MNRKTKISKEFRNIFTPNVQSVSKKKLELIKYKIQDFLMKNTYAKTVIHKGIFSYAVVTMFPLTRKNLKSILL